ncbi:MAG: hypothetical protein M3254_02605 [Actinomycetota bacterium]|nr:hypothetical protein [Actinomycetota bacterium]
MPNSSLINITSHPHSMSADRALLVPLPVRLEIDKADRYGSAPTSLICFRLTRGYRRVVRGM